VRTASPKWFTIEGEAAGSRSRAESSGTDCQRSGGSGDGRLADERKKVEKRQDLRILTAAFFLSSVGVSLPVMSDNLCVLSFLGIGILQ